MERMPSGTTAAKATTRSTVGTSHQAMFCRRKTRNSRMSPGGRLPLGDEVAGEERFGGAALANEQGA